MLVTLDFETYWDKDYSLSKMSTSEYVRDKRFEALSCSIKLGSYSPYCYFGDEIWKGIDEIKIRGGDVILLAHHTQFDGLILTHHYKYTPARWADTLSMSRLLLPKYMKKDLGAVAKYYGVANKLDQPNFKGKHLKDLTDEDKKAIIAYNNGDVQSCYEIYEIVSKDFPPTELEIIDMTIRMFTEPVLKVDLKLARQELKLEQLRKETAITASGVDIAVLSSNPKFATELGKHVNVPMKPSPSVKDKFIPAIAKADDELQALRTHPNVNVVNLVEGRLAAKSVIGETRAARLITAGSRGFSLPVYYNYAMAHTLRFSGGDKLNFQNFKQQARVGGALSSAIRAPKGFKMVRFDFSQIEARLTAWLAEEQWVLDAFFDLRDLYCEFASIAYGRPITKADIAERFVGKTCILGLGFGMGGLKLQSSLLQKSVDQGLPPVRLELETCYRLVTTYRAQCQKIVALWKFLNDRGLAAMMAGPGGADKQPLEYKGVKFSKYKCTLPNGLSLLYPELKGHVVGAHPMFASAQMYETVQDASYHAADGRSKIYGGLFLENIIQALARIIMTDVMLIIGRKYRIVMMTHDEVVFLVPNKKAKDALEWALELASAPPDWAPDLPLAAEGSYSDRYSKTG